MIHPTRLAGKAPLPPPRYRLRLSIDSASPTGSAQESPGAVGTAGWVFLATLVALGFVLRLAPAVRSPFFYDEYKMARLVDGMSLAPSTFSVPLHGDRHPPGQVYWSYLATSVIGRNALGYRAPALLAGTLCIGLAFVLGRSLAGSRAGFIAAGLAATNEYLIGTSRIATELSAFLLLCLLGLVQFQRALERPTSSRLAVLGLLFGLATLTKESAVLWWLPLLAILVARSGGLRFLRTAAPWAAIATYLAAIAPAVYWSLVAIGDPSDPSGAGLAFQADRLSLGSWSWGPLALYIRPLYHFGVEQEISEYASMTTLPGILLLAGGALSLGLLRDAKGRILQSLGFGVFLFIALLTTPRGEFWWADLTVPSFLLLTAAVLARVPRHRWILYLVVSAIALPPALRLAATHDSYYPLDIGTPAPDAVRRVQHALRFQFLAFRERDHLALYRLRTLDLPPLRDYRESLLAYREYLARPEGFDTAMAAAIRRIRPVATDGTGREVNWVDGELARLRGGAPGTSEDAGGPGARERK